MIVSYLIGIFAGPLDIGSGAQSLLWLLPLAVAIAVIYKVTKMPVITLLDFTKEVVILSGSIIAFMMLATIVLYTMVWWITE